MDSTRLQVVFLNFFFFLQVQYKNDCQEFYGKTLDNSNVVSSLRGTCTKKTEAIWNRLYPEEPYDFNFANASSAESSADLSKLEKHTKYDLISAVRRQSPFSYQVIGILLFRFS